MPRDAANKKSHAHHLREAQPAATFFGRSWSRRHTLYWERSVPPLWTTCWSTSHFALTLCLAGGVCGTVILLVCLAFATSIELLGNDGVAAQGCQGHPRFVLRCWRAIHDETCLQSSFGTCMVVSVSVSVAASVSASRLHGLGDALIVALDV